MPVPERAVTFQHSSHDRILICMFPSSMHGATSNGTCHLMGPSAELRLAVAEHIFEDFFTRFNLGLYPPFFTNGESKVPYTQELFTVLQTNHSFRLDTINLCNRFATRSAEEVVRLPPGDSTQ